MSKRLSIWLFGGIGTGHFNQGIPALEKLLSGLSGRFELVIYSLSPLNTGYHPSNFIVRSAPRWITSNLLRWMCLVFYFLQDHRTKRFQVLFSFWGYPSGLIVVILGKFFGLPSIVYLLGSDAAGIPSINYGILHHPRLRRRAFWVYKSASRLLCISEYQKKELHKFGFDGKLHVIPWGADLSLFHFKERTRGSRPLNVLHVGHLAPVKDQFTLLKAFLRIRSSHPARLRVIGVDTLDRALQEFSRTLGVSDEVEFLGMIPYHEMPSYFEWADLMLHTSLSEGQSMAMTEATASGVLLAGTRVGLLHDLGGECGILIETGDSESLAAETLALLSDESQWQQKILNARKWSAAHDAEWTLSALVKVIEDC